jgi:uncharacterized BrkB/YihY/UPF0761 family membrane protein
MRWVTGLLIAAQIPFVAMTILLAGADGNRQNLVRIYLTCIPLLGVTLFALYRLVTADRMLPRDLVAIAVAFVPVVWVIASTAFRRRRRPR